jgi:hypothetical protein
VNACSRQASVLGTVPFERLFYMTFRYILLGTKKNGNSQIQQNEEEHHSPSKRNRDVCLHNGPGLPLTDPSPGTNPSIYPSSLPQGHLHYESQEDGKLENFSRELGKCVRLRTKVPFEIQVGQVYVTDQQNRDGEKFFDEFGAKVSTVVCRLYLVQSRL